MTTADDLTACIQQITQLQRRLTSAKTFPTGHYVYP